MNAIAIAQAYEVRDEADESIARDDLKERAEMCKPAPFEIAIESCTPVAVIRDIGETFALLAGYPSAEAHKKAMKASREFYRRSLEEAARIRDEREGR